MDGNLDKFVRSMPKESDKSRLLQLADKFLRTDFIPSDPSVVDHRYFHVMPSGVDDPIRVSGCGYSVCGVARGIMAAMVQVKEGDALFLKEA